MLRLCPAAGYVPTDARQPWLATMKSCHSKSASIGDDADLEEVYDTERQLLYVACTRARDNLLVTSVEPSSEFLDDFKHQ
jgi:superfamily I DNA/RNA helicase